MITGDHVVTASAIARELGILEDGDKAITGVQLDEMDEETLAREVEHMRRIRSAFARKQDTHSKGMAEKGAGRLHDGRRRERRSRP